MSEAIKVAVRVRPFNARERERGARCIVRMNGATTTILHPDSEESRAFTFDHSYWSHDGFEADEAGYLRPAGDSSAYASQERVFADLGTGLLDNAWAGYNVCLFAYGQTGSGKSYSVVGYGENRGIVPLACEEIFRRKAAQESDALQVHVTVSMLEIYNEKLRDLLAPGAAAAELKLRATPKGTFVEGAKRCAAQSYSEIDALMSRGTLNRTVASTSMNATSSRAHTVVTITVAQLRARGDGGEPTEVACDINLVDLAGSERADATGATGTRLKEGTAINQSLSALGAVISALAEQAAHPKKRVLAAKRVAALEADLNEARARGNKAAADAGAGKSKLCTIL